MRDASGWTLALNCPLPVNGSGRWGARRSGIKEEQSAKAAAGDSRVAECAVGLIPPQTIHKPVISNSVKKLTCVLTGFKDINTHVNYVTKPQKFDDFQEKSDLKSREMAI